MRNDFEKILQNRIILNLKKIKMREIPNKAMKINKSRLLICIENLKFSTFPNSDLDIFDF